MGGGSPLQQEHIESAWTRGSLAVWSEATKEEDRKNDAARFQAAPVNQLED